MGYEYDYLSPVLFPLLFTTQRNQLLSTAKQPTTQSNQPTQYLALPLQAHNSNIDHHLRLSRFFLVEYICLYCMLTYGE